MVDFKIRRGPSTVLFSESGVINPKLVIEEGCWYLCTDTAELFLGVLEDGELTLRRINGNISGDGDGSSSSNPNFARIIEELRNEVATLKSTELFQKINTEAELPIDFTSENFNPNITYYIPSTEDKVSTFIFDKETQSYVCTNSIDESAIKTLVSDVIELTFDESLEAKLPKAIKQTFETVILYGGDASSKT